MTINTAASTPTGSPTITVTATGGGATHTTTFTLTVNAIPFDFTLTNGGNKTITQGSSVTNTVTATLASGTTTAVTFSALGLPANASASFSPTSCNPTCTTTMTINTAASTPTGSPTITVTATGGGATHTTTFTLTVTQANQLPVGNLDQIDPTGLIRGWTYDPDSSSVSNQVQIYLNGPAGSGTLIATITANVDRPDIRTTFGITGNHGFQFNVPPTYQDGAYHSVYVYGVDTSSSSLTALLTNSGMGFTSRTFSIMPEALPSLVTTATLSVLNSSKTDLMDIPVTSNASGQFVVYLNIPAQTVYFKMLVPYYLTRLLSNVNLSQQVSSVVPFPKLFAGDLNQDNFINALDYSILNTHWFSSDPVADINHDGIVNSIDFSFMNQHWLVNGDQ